MSQAALVAGVGFLAPVPLHGMPVVGQLAASLRLGVSRLDAALGGAVSKARRGLAFKGAAGVTAGVGCGVALGYGWGAGVMLKPTALQSLGAALNKAVPPSVAAAASRLGMGNPPAVAASERQPAVESTTSRSKVVAPSDLAQVQQEVAELAKALVRQQNSIDALHGSLQALHRQIARPAENSTT